MRQRFRVCQEGCSLTGSYKRPIHWLDGTMSWEIVNEAPMIDTDTQRDEKKRYSMELNHIINEKDRI